MKTTGKKIEANYVLSYKHLSDPKPEDIEKVKHIKEVHIVENHFGNIAVFIKDSDVKTVQHALHDWNVYPMGKLNYGI
jgi:hypothetical protein